MQLLVVFLLELFFLDERLELVHVDRIAGHDRHELRLRQRSHLDLDQGEALFLHFLFELLEPVLLLFRDRFDQRHPLLAVLLRIEQAPQVGRERLDQLVHRFPKGASVARGKHQPARLVVVLKVVHVDQIRQTGLAELQAVEHAPHDGRATAAHVAGDEDVVALAAHRQAQPQSLHRPVLTNDVDRAVFHLIGGLEGELARIAAPAQLVGAHAQRVGRDLGFGFGPHDG